MIERLQDDVSDIICGERNCDNCKLHEYKNKHGIMWCDEVPLQFQLEYAHELIASGDELMLQSLKKNMNNPDYANAIAYIKIGGIVYD